MQAHLRIMPKSALNASRDDFKGEPLQLRCAEQSEAHRSRMKPFVTSPPYDCFGLDICHWHFSFVRRFLAVVTQ